MEREDARACTVSVRSRDIAKLAAHKLAHEKPGQTLQATALVHEAYARLVQGARTQQWNSRGHFFAAAAEAMRRILVERARHKQSLKASGGYHRAKLGEIEAPDAGRGLNLLALDEALDRLEKPDMRQAALIKLRFFAGLTIDRAADVLGIKSDSGHGQVTRCR